MAFESLSEKLGAAFKKLRGKGRLKEADIKEAMREVRLALLEADVGFKVVRDFVKTVSERSLGADVLESLTPAQMVIKIVNEELCALMGGANAKLTISSKPPTIIMLIGLQGSGKTTNGAKLAAYMRKHHSKRPLLVACDIYRPAAILQLQTVGRQLDIPVFEMGVANPVQIAKSAVAHATKHGNDIVFLDTAGRLHIDDDLINELKAIKAAVPPTEILLVIDAMTGQDAVNSAKAFNERLELDGVILTKFDSDARGGAALSVKSVTGKPIKFIGVGEKLDKLEEFRPDGMASRILGMGDVVALVKKAQEEFDQEQAAKLQEKMAKGRFTLNDFLGQMKQMKKLGSMKDILKLLPGMGSMAGSMEDMGIDDGEMERMEAIIHSMTPKERENPDLIEANRRRRIARGSGTEPEDVSGMIKSFNMAAGMMKQMSGMGIRDRMKFAQQMGQMGMSGAMPKKLKQRSHRLTKKEREKNKKKKGKR